MYEKRFTAFIDFLGFRDFITKNDPLEIFDIIQSLSQTNITGKKLFFSDLQYQAFSDNIVLSVLPETHGIFAILFQVQWLCLNALKMGAFMRGGITFDDLKQDSAKNLVFGPALIQAYDLESTIAIFPRIVLSKSAIDLIKKHEAELSELTTNGFSETYIRQSYDGVHHLHIFSRASQKPEEMETVFKPRIEKALSENIGKPNIYKKIRWFAEYYNETIKQDIYKGDKIEFLSNKDKFIHLPSWP